MNNKMRTAAAKVLFRLRLRDAPFRLRATLMLAMAATLGPVSVSSQDVIVTKLVPTDGVRGKRFGTGISIDGGTAVVGSRHDDSDSGAAYVFSRKLNGWSQDAKLLPSAPSPDAVFGSSVLVDGDTILVGAPSTFNTDQSGSAYIFVRNGANWTQEAKLTRGDPAPGDRFGSSLAKDGDTIVIGSPGFLVPDFVYIFVRDVEGWHEKARLAASVGHGRAFGRSVALQGETIIVGAPIDKQSGGPESSGSAFSFSWDGAIWTEQQKLLPLSMNEGARFGQSMSLDDDALIISAPGGIVGWDRPGAVHFFHQTGSVWEEQVEFVGDPPSDLDQFAHPLSLDGGIALVGAAGDDDACLGDPNCNSGAAYFFVQGDDGWAARTKITLPDQIPGDRFGGILDLDFVNERAIIGAIGDDSACPSDPDCNSGAAYIYENIGVLLAPPPNAVPAQIWKQYR